MRGLMHIANVEQIIRIVPLRLKSRVPTHQIVIGIITTRYARFLCIKNDLINKSQYQLNYIDINVVNGMQTDKWEQSVQLTSLIQ